MSTDNLTVRHFHKRALSRGWIRSALRGNLLCVGCDYRDDQVFFDVAAFTLGEACASLWATASSGPSSLEVRW